MLSEMRDKRGGPNRRMRVLALVLALLLAGPLTALVLQGAVRLLSAAWQQRARSWTMRTERRSVTSR